MEIIMQKIIDFDEKERQMLKEALEMKDHAEEKISQNRAKINKRYIAETEEKAEVIAKQILESLPKQLKDEDKICQNFMSILKEEQHKQIDIWIKEIFEKTIEQSHE